MVYIDGRRIFNKDNESTKTPYFSKKVGPQPQGTKTNEDGSQYKAENFIATMNDPLERGKEYLVSITKESQYTEL